MNFLVQIVTALSAMFDSSDSQILVGIPSRQIEQVAAAARGVASIITTMIMIMKLIYRIDLTRYPSRLILFMVNMNIIRATAVT